MIKTSLHNPDGQELHTGKPWKEQFPPTMEDELLITEDYVRAHSVFQSVTRTEAGTTTVVSPSGLGSLVLVDLILSATKVNAATVSLVFDDDTDSETLFTIALTNQPVTITWGVTGRMQGWRDARLDLVTVNSTVAFVTVVYMRLPTGLIFSEWDALR